MKLSTAITVIAGEKIGTLHGGIHLIGEHGRVGDFDYEITGFDIFNIEREPVSIKITWQGQVVVDMAAPNDPTALSAEEKTRNFILLNLAVTGLERFIGLLETFQFKGQPFASSEQLSPEESTWLVLKVIAGTLEPTVDLDAMKGHCDIAKLLPLLHL